MGWRKNHRSRSKNCVHTDTVIVRSTGIERAMCETCGHLSIRFVSEPTEEFQRTVFARQADETEPLNPRGGNHLVPVPS